MSKDPSLDVKRPSAEGELASLDVKRPSAEGEMPSLDDKRASARSEAADLHVQTAFSQRVKGIFRRAKCLSVSAAQPERERTTRFSTPATVRNASAVVFRDCSRHKKKTLGS